MTAGNTLTRTLRRACGKAWRQLEPAMLRTIRGVPAFEVKRLDSYADFVEDRERTRALDDQRTRSELALIPADGPGSFRVEGYCGVCQQWTRFHVDYGYSGESGGGPPVPNWRESLSCPRCGLNNRMRACLQFLRDYLRPAPNASIYMTEQVTSLFARVRDLYPNTVGSEFLSDGTPAGSTNSAGVRHEDLTRLSFADAQFDYILTFEVLEHVPDYRAALRECARVLKPGGVMLATVPFHGKPSTTVRARVVDGAVEHILPPEYHGDPLTTDGCLCFYHFGGDFLDDLKAASFRESSICVTYSQPLGNLLRDSPLFLATK